MARIDNLTNFVTDVAAAIRRKSGTSGAISCSQFDTQIDSIQTGTSSQIKLTDIVANGTPNSVPTTALTLTFSADPTGLAAANITVTGATKVAFSGSGNTRTLAISDITVGQGQSVTIAFTGIYAYAVTPASIGVAVNILTAGWNICWQGSQNIGIIRADGNTNLVTLNTTLPLVAGKRTSITFNNNLAFMLNVRDEYNFVLVRRPEYRDEPQLDNPLDNPLELDGGTGFYEICEEYVTSNDDGVTSTLTISVVNGTQISFSAEGEAYGSNKDYEILGWGNVSSESSPAGTYEPLYITKVEQYYD